MKIMAELLPEQRMGRWYWQLWWSFCGLFHIYEINWWLKERYFGTSSGIHDRELWEAIRENPLRIFRTIK